MGKLSCIMIISNVYSTGSSLSNKASITGKVSGKVLFNTIEANGGQEFSATFISDYGAFSVGAEFSRNESYSFTGVVNKSSIKIDNISTVNFEFKGDVDSSATIYGLMK